MVVGLVFIGTANIGGYTVGHTLAPHDSLPSSREGGEGIPQTSPLIWRLPQHAPDSTPKRTFTDPKTHRRLPQHSRDSTPKLTFRGNFSWFSAGLRHPES